MNLYVQTVYVSNNRGDSIADQLRGYLRGQWVRVNGMTARIVNIVNGHAVLWMQRDKMIAVWP